MNQDRELPPDAGSSKQAGSRKIPSFYLDPPVPFKVPLICGYFAGLSSLAFLEYYRVGDQSGNRRFSRHAIDLVLCLLLPHSLKAIWWELFFFFLTV
ncbi:MAG: hypothetical protein JOS17DRAFT_275185 [Linnemannia elongata]|nr:MAG: hypothetical protein JOS17DRAFT_275185 [Linnemannia elongata]